MPRRPTSQSPMPVKRASRELASYVDAWRKLLGLTQNQLADRAGIDRKAVIRLEQGDSGISLESYLRVLYALGVLHDVVRASDPYETDLGRSRAEEVLPHRVRTRDLSQDD